MYLAGARPCRAAEGASAAGAWENPVHMSRALICRSSHCELQFHLYTEGSFMTRLCEQIYLTPMTKGNSSLQEDPSIQMDASTQKFRKSVTLYSFYLKIRGGKKYPNFAVHTSTRLEGRSLLPSDLTFQTLRSHLSCNESWEIPKPAGWKCCFPVTTDWLPVMIPVS